MTFPDDPCKPPLLTKDFLYLLIGTFAGTTALGIFYLFPLFVLDLGGNKSDIGILMGVMSLSAVGVRPWISGRVDRIGRKAAFHLGCMILAGVSIVHIYFVGPIDSVFYLLMLLRFIYGIGLGLVIVASLTFATDLVPPQRLNEGLGLFGIMPLLGIAVGPVIGEVILNTYGFTGMFSAAACTSGVAMLLVLPIKEEFRSGSGGKRGGFFAVIKYPVVWRMTLVILTFGVAFAAHGGFVAPFAESRSLTVSIYFITYSAAAVTSRLFGGRLVRHFGESKVIPAALLIMGCGFLWLVQVDTHIGLAVTGLLAGSGHGIFFPSIMALSVRSIHAGDRGKITGVITGGVDAGVLIGSFSLGQLGEIFGFQILFTVAATFVFLGFALFLCLGRALPQPTTHVTATGRSEPGPMENGDYRSPPL